MNLKSTSAKLQQVSSSTSNLTEIEKRLSQLEKISHKPCGGSSNEKIDLSGLPELPPRKTTDINTRVTAIENKLEALIEKLSK